MRISRTSNVIAIAKMPSLSIVILSSPAFFSVSKAVGLLASSVPVSFSFSDISIYAPNAKRTELMSNSVQIYGSSIHGQRNTVKLLGAVIARLHAHLYVQATERLT